MSNKTSMKEKLAKFFQALKHNWFSILLSLFSGTLLVLLLSYAGS